MANRILATLLLSAARAVVEFPLDSISGNAAWVFTPANSSYTAPAVVPGVVHLDLLRAGLLSEPNNGFNEELQLWIPSENFTYTALFSPPASFADLNLVRIILAGVDTAASVSLNGVTLGNLDNMHRTYVIPLPIGVLRPGLANNLTVAFTGAVPASLARQAACESASKPCAFANCTCPAPWPGPAPQPLLINAYLRKEQQDFSWDFAPSTATCGLRVAPLLWGTASAALREGAVVSMDLDGGYWNVNVTVRVEGSGGGTATAEISGVPGATASVPVALPVGHTSVEATVRLSFPDASSIKKWWPRGYGEAALYPLVIVFNSSTGEVSAHRPLQLGFRKVVLEQPPAPNGGFLFRLRVNGVAIHARGSNWVPHNSIPLRLNAEAELAGLVSSAVFANHNILRIWGGGVYAPTSLLDATDEYGILVFHDAMFGDQFYNTQRDFLDSVGAEIRDNLFRMGHHPSLAILCGNNEMVAGYSDGHHLPPSAFPYYSALYFDTILSNFSSLLPFTPTVSSTPSNGNETREHPWSSSSKLVTQGDIHWYNLDGDCFNQSSYPRPRWITEHGWESFPSFFTLAPTLMGPPDYSFNSTLVASRQQHPPGQGQITAMVDLNWGWPSRTRIPLAQRTARYGRLRGKAARLAARADEHLAESRAPLLPLLKGHGVGAPNATAFRDELHMTQVAAGYCLRLALQRWRAFADDFSEEGGGTAGILYWQLDEPWPGPSWATLEVGGRRKVGHYLARWAFAPLLVAGALVVGEGLVVDASMTTYDSTLLPPPGANGTLTLRAFAWAGGALGTLVLPSLPLPLPHSTSRLFTFPDLSELLSRVNCPAPELCVIELSLAEDITGRTLAENHVLLTPPRQFVEALRDPGLVIEQVAAHGAKEFHVTITCARPPAAFVWAESSFAGVWSDNAMLLVEGVVTLVFNAEEPLDAAEFSASLAVSSLWDVYGK